MSAQRCVLNHIRQRWQEHNNANVIAFGARVIGIEMAKMILDTFLGAEFLGGRHQDRVDMIMAIEENQ